MAKGSMICRCKLICAKSNDIDTGPQKDVLHVDLGIQAFPPADLAEQGSSPTSKESQARGIRSRWQGKCCDIVTNDD